MDFHKYILTVGKIDTRRWCFAYKLLSILRCHNVQTKVWTPTKVGRLLINLFFSYI